MIVDVGGQRYDFPDDATDAEINAAIGPAKATPGVAEDVAKSTAIAVPQTAIGFAGLPGLARQGVAAASDYIAGKLGASPEMLAKVQATREGMPLDVAKLAQPPAAIQGAVEQATGPFYKPQTVPGQYANTLTQFGLSGGRSGLIPRVVAGVGSEAAGQLAEGTPAEIPVRIGGALIAGGAAGKIGNVLKARQAEKAIAGVTPTGEQLGDIVDQGYTSLRNSGVELHPTAVSKAIGDIRTDLHSGTNSIDPSLTPRINTLLGQAESRLAPAQPGAMSALTGVQPAAKAGVEFGVLDALRRNLGAVAKDKVANATEAGAATRAQKALDKAIEDMANQPGAVLKGDAAALARGAAEARGNAAAEFRLTAIDALRQRAADQAKATHSGLNYENALKGQVKSFVRPNNKGISPAMTAGVNDAEIAALRRSIGGTLGTRTLRYAGNLLGGGGGLGGLAAFEVGNEGGGHGAGGLALGLTSLLAGRALRGTSNAIARKQAERLGALIASRSPAAVAARATLPAPRYTPLLGSLALPTAIGSDPRQR